MEWSRRVVVAAGTLGAIWLHAGAIARAQEDAHAEPSPPDARATLDDMVGVRSQGNDEAAQVQRRIDLISETTDDLLAQYRTALKQIDSLSLYNQQMGDLIAAQSEELISLKDQVDRVEIVGRSVTPLMMLMIDALEKFVRLDVPFLIEERTARIAELSRIMGRPDVTTAEKFRQIMEAYQIENEYGRTIEAYRAALKLHDLETTVDFLRFGRIALVYQSLDEADAGVWNRETRSWTPLDSSYRSAIRRGLRIARRQAAPDLISLPLPAPVDAEGSN
jgi:hypothetical protein